MNLTNHQLNSFNNKGRKWSQLMIVWLLFFIVNHCLFGCRENGEKNKEVKILNFRFLSVNV